MSDVNEIFGCNVFNESVMQARLPKTVFKSLKKTMLEGKEVSKEIVKYDKFLFRALKEAENITLGFNIDVLEGYGIELNAEEVERWIKENKKWKN